MPPSKKGNPVKKQESGIIPERYQHLAANLFILFSLIIFFHELVFEGKVFLASDNIASKSFHTYIQDTKDQEIFPLWNPYIFCGMPGYASLMVHGERYFDITALIVNRASVLFGALINNADVGWGLFYYVLLGIGIYWLVYQKLNNKIAALIAGLAVMHSTFIVILIMVGHMTKVPVIAFFPFIFLILEKLREKFSLPLTLALTVLIHLMLLPSHIQMIFYCYFAFGIYYLFYFIRALVKKENWLGIVRSGAVFAVATVLALAMTGDQYLSTLEYSKYSMRGSDPIISTSQQGEANKTSGGLDYDYATSWSFSPSELITLFIPSSHGFGWHHYQGILSQNQLMRLNTYFGNMPFTDAPQYMGIVIIVLAGIGFWRHRNEPFVQYIGIIIFISILISFGKELSLFYDIMFYYFPMFNKFRIPSMILILVQILTPVLAAYGIVALMNDAKEKNLKRQKILLYSLIGIGALVVLSILSDKFIISIYEIFFSQQEVVKALSRTYGENQSVLNELYKIVTSLVVSDVIFGGLFLISGLGVLYLYQTGKTSISMVTIVLTAGILFDLWRVNYKPMDSKPHRDSQELFATPGYVNFLKSDTTLYRTLEFENGQPPYNNMLAYWRIQSAYGYSGTKMRQIQDMFDVIGLGNPLLWGLMNVKYIISDRPDSNQVLLPIYQSQGKYILYNRMVLPRTFFVHRYEVARGIEILNSIKAMSFNPQEVAYVMEDPQVKIDVPIEGASVEYTSFGVQEISLKAKATGNNLLFISEAWYPEGWRAFIDGTETTIHRLNYMFRGIVVPEGEHTITMKFEPRGFSWGKTASLSVNIIVLIGLTYFSFIWYKERRNSQRSAT